MTATSNPAKFISRRYRPKSIVIGASPFAGWSEIKVVVGQTGAITMDRFGDIIKPSEAEAIGLALIKAAACSRERVAGRRGSR